MILDKILQIKKEEVALRKKSQNPQDMKEAVRDIPPPRDFSKALLSRNCAVIAEVKRKSPSRGEFKAGLDIGLLAKAYEQNGAASISVLTDREFFGGSERDLVQIRQLVDIPLLRKDFIIDQYQIYETRLIGADAVLLIARILGRSELQDFIGLAELLGLSALVEVHSPEDVENALSSGAQIIGINNRDLTTFHTRIDITLGLLPHIPREKTIVSESGIASRADIERLLGSGVKVFLVGEALVKSANPATKLKELLGD